MAKFAEMSTVRGELPKSGMVKVPEVVPFEVPEATWWYPEPVSMLTVQWAPPGPGSPVMPMLKVTGSPGWAAPPPGPAAPTLLRSQACATAASTSMHSPSETKLMIRRDLLMDSDGHSTLSRSTVIRRSANGSARSNGNGRVTEMETRLETAPLH